MANITLTYWGLTGIKGTVTVDETVLVDGLITAIATDEGLDTNYYVISKLDDPSKSSYYFSDSSTTIDTIGITASSVILCTPNQNGSKEARQIQKLDIAQVKRQAGGDPTKIYYRAGNIYDLTSLPDTYNGNDTDPDDNPNTGGLIEGRPWVGVASVAAPETIAEAVPAAVLVDLQVWYDGSDTSTFVPSATDESTITQWTDKSNFARNANPIGGVVTRPSYENTVLQNGNGYLEFDGGDTLTINPFSALVSQTGFSVFIVAKAANTTGLKYLIETNQNDLRVSFNGTEVVTGMATSTETSSGLGFDTAWHVHSFIFDGSGAPDPAATNLYRLDSVGIVRTGSGTGPATTSASNNTLYIGNRSTGGAGWNGFIGEVILFNRTLTSVEYQNVENYLSNKWGL